MEVREAIRARRNVGAMKPDMASRAEIERVLELAVWAPNHRMTEPWGFHLISGDAREKLGAAMESALKASGVTHTAELAAERAKPSRTPVVVVVSAKTDEDEVLAWENQWATAAAVQNLLLCAQDAGMATFWKTGATMYSRDVADYLGFDDGEKVIAAVYMGYSDAPEKSGRRTPASEFTTWLQ